MRKSWQKKHAIYRLHTREQGSRRNSLFKQNVVSLEQNTTETLTQSHVQDVKKRADIIITSAIIRNPFKQNASID